MKHKLLCAALLIAANTSFASIVNGNFSAGTSGWTTNGPVSVINVGGNNVADLYAGLGENVYTTLSQSLNLNAGDVLTGYAQFFAHDYLPFDDNAFVAVNGTNIFTASISTVGSYSAGNLTAFTYTAPVAGVYNLVAGVANALDNGLSSELQISQVAVHGNAVPEPASLALLGLGLFGVAAARRKRQQH